MASDTSDSGFESEDCESKLCHGSVCEQSLGVRSYISDDYFDLNPSNNVISSKHQAERGLERYRRLKTWRHVCADAERLLERCSGAYTNEEAIFLSSELLPLVDLPHAQDVHCVAHFKSHISDIVVTQQNAGAHNEMRVWHVSDSLQSPVEKEIKLQRFAMKDTIVHLEYVAKLRLYAAYCADVHVRLYAAHNSAFKCLAETLCSHTIHCLAFIPETDELLAGGYGCLVRWNISNHRKGMIRLGPLNLQIGRDDRVLRLTPAPRGQLWVLLEHVLVLYSHVEARVLRHVPNAHNSALTCAVHYPQRDYLFTGSRDGSIKVWSSAVWSLMTEFRGGQYDSVTALLLHPRQPLLLAACADHKLRVWRLDTFQCMKEHEVCGVMVGMKLLNARELLYWTAHSVRIVDLGLFYEFYCDTESRVVSVERWQAPSSADDRLVLSVDDGSIRIMSPETATTLSIVYPIPFYKGVSNIIYERNESKLYSLFFGEVLVFDCAGPVGRPVYKIAPEDADLPPLCLGAVTMAYQRREGGRWQEDTLVFTGHRDGTVALIQSCYFRLTLPFKAHHGRVEALQRGIQGQPQPPSTPTDPISSQYHDPETTVLRNSPAHLASATNSVAYSQQCDAPSTLTGNSDTAVANQNKAQMDTHQNGMSKPRRMSSSTPVDMDVITQSGQSQAAPSASLECASAPIPQQPVSQNAMPMVLTTTPLSSEANTKSFLTATYPATSTPPATPANIKCRLVTTGSDFRIRVWGLEATGQTLRVAMLHEVMVPESVGLMCLLNSTLCYTLKNSSSKLEFVLVAEAEPARRLPVNQDFQHTQSLSGLCCCPDLQLFATAGGDGLLKLWNAASAHVVRELSFDWSLNNVCFATRRGDLLVGLQNHAYCVAVQDYLPVRYLEQLITRNYEDEVVQLPREPACTDESSLWHDYSALPVVSADIEIRTHELHVLELRSELQSQLQSRQDREEEEEQEEKETWLAQCHSAVTSRLVEKDGSVSSSSPRSEVSSESHDLDSLTSSVSWYNSCPTIHVEDFSHATLPCNRDADPHQPSRDLPPSRSPALTAQPANGKSGEITMPKVRPKAVKPSASSRRTSRSLGGGVGTRRSVSVGGDDEEGGKQEAEVSALSEEEMMAERARAEQERLEKEQEEQRRREEMRRKYPVAPDGYIPNSVVRGQMKFKPPDVLTREEAFKLKPVPGVTLPRCYSEDLQTETLSTLHWSESSMAQQSSVSEKAEPAAGKPRPDPVKKPVSDTAPPPATPPATPPAEKPYTLKMQQIEQPKPLDADKKKAAPKVDLAKIEVGDHEALRNKNKRERSLLSRQGTQITANSELEEEEVPALLQRLLAEPWMPLGTAPTLPAAVQALLTLQPTAAPLIHGPICSYYVQLHQELVLPSALLERVISSLISVLQSGSGVLRGQAVRTLRQLGANTQQALLGLLPLLLDNDSLVKAEVTGALKDLAGVSNKDELLDLMTRLGQGPGSALQSSSSQREMEALRALQEALSSGDLALSEAEMSSRIQNWVYGLPSALDQPEDFITDEQLGLASFANGHGLDPRRSNYGEGSETGSSGSPSTEGRGHRSGMVRGKGSRGKTDPKAIRGGPKGSAEYSAGALSGSVSVEPVGAVRPVQIAGVPHSVHIVQDELGRHYARSPSGAVRPITDQEQADWGINVPTALSAQYSAAAAGGQIAGGQIACGQNAGGQNAGADDYAGVSAVIMASQNGQQLDSYVPLPQLTAQLTAQQKDNLDSEGSETHSESGDDSAPGGATGRSRRPTGQRRGKGGKRGRAGGRGGAGGPDSGLDESDPSNTRDSQGEYDSGFGFSSDDNASFKNKGGTLRNRGQPLLSPVKSVSDVQPNNLQRLRDFLERPDAQARRQQQQARARGASLGEEGTPRPASLPPILCIRDDVVIPGDPGVRLLQRIEIQTGRHLGEESDGEGGVTSRRHRINAVPGKLGVDSMEENGSTRFGILNMSWTTGSRDPGAGGGRGPRGGRGGPAGGTHQQQRVGEQWQVTPAPPYIAAAQHHDDRDLVSSLSGSTTLPQLSHTHYVCDTPDPGTAWRGGAPLGGGGGGGRGGFAWAEPLPPAPPLPKMAAVDETVRRRQQHYCAHYALLKQGLHQFCASPEKLLSRLTSQRSTPAPASLHPSPAPPDSSRHLMRRPNLPLRLPSLAHIKAKGQDGKVMARSHTEDILRPVPRGKVAQEAGTQCEQEDSGGVRWAALDPWLGEHQGSPARLLGAQEGGTDSVAPELLAS